MMIIARPTFMLRAILLSSTVVLLSGNCGQPRQSYDPGVERVRTEDGRTRLIVTGRASEAAINENSYAMRQTTSCRAAKDMLANELGTSVRREQERLFQLEDTLLINEAEYCRIIGVLR